MASFWQHVNGSGRNVNKSVDNFLEFGPQKVHVAREPRQVLLMNYQQFMILLTLTTTYIFLGHVTLILINQQSEQHVINNFKETTLIVVAHPDDETMFFGPTILNLVRNSKSIDLLCLTNGNSDGIGQQREHELSEVVRALSPNMTLMVVKDPDLPDNITKVWDKLKVIEHIQNHIQRSSRTIGTLLTFDNHGVSGHSNHKSVYEAVYFLRTGPAIFEPRILILKSLGLWRKYNSFLDSIPTFVMSYLPSYDPRKSFSLGIDITKYSSLKSTLLLHRSQMLWFRQLYMMFSRYMFINDLEYL